MVRTAFPFWNRILPVLALTVVVLAALPFRAAAEIRYDNYIYEDENFLERMDDVRRTTSSPFEDVPPDHWAYQSVMRLVQSGLLQGYEGELFRGDQVVTRYELATIISRLLDNYLTWYRSGRLPAREYSSESYDAGRSLPSTGPPLSAIAPPEAVISPTRRVSVELPSLGRMGIARTQPHTMGEEQQESDLEKFKQELLEEARKVVNETMDEKIKLTKKDIDDLEKLVNEFQKELKTMNKDLNKKISETNKIALRNQADIKKLEQENKRFSINGTERFYWMMQGPVTGDGCWEDEGGGMYERCNMRSTDLYNTIQLDFTSQPDTNQDLTIGGTMLASVKLGGRRNQISDMSKPVPGGNVTDGAYDYWMQQNQAAYNRYTEGQSTALTLRDLYISYNNTNRDSENPRNFKLLSMNVGNIAPTYSMLTIFGKKLEGVSANLQLNDYTISMFGARERLHQRTPTLLPDDEGTNWYNTTFFNEDQYDRYRHGFTIETQLFGNPGSRMNLSRMQIYDNKDTNYPGCNNGQWLDLSFSYDQYSFKKPDSDVSTTDMFCRPPEKIGVSSVFIMYPLVEGLTMMSEYAHSSYNKEGYKILKPYNTTANCNTADPNNEYVCWWESREENFQDDAFFVFFSYNKGPLTIFPVGYARLGPEFHTDLDLGGLSGGGDSSGIQFGSGSGGGLDTSTLSILPISIKSLNLFVGSVKFDINPKSNVRTMLLTGEEIKPMYFDPGLLAWGFRNNSGKETSIPILSTALDRLNNRTSKLQLKYWSSSYRHYITDKLLFQFDYSRMSAKLPTSCLDGNITLIYDNTGALVDKVAGNGITDCVLEDSSGDINFGLNYWNHTQRYAFDWQTSKKSRYVMGYEIADSDLTMKFTSAVEDVVLNLAPRGKKYTWINEYRYSLTDSTLVKFYFEQGYDRYPQGSDTGGEKYPVRDYNRFLFTVESSF